jgi:hypothetical protein
VIHAFGWGCNALLGADRYYTVPDGDSGIGGDPDGRVAPVDAAAGGNDSAADAKSDAPPDALACDAGTGCYACTPTTSTQIQNACTTATCVPFDDSVRLAHLLADGALPPLPPVSVDAGGD